jgi:hypothetical protein
MQHKCNTKSKKPATRAGYKGIRADRTGLEPATSAVTGRHSNQLNYRSKYFISTFPEHINNTVGNYRSGFCNSGAQDNKISTEVFIKISFLNLLF